MDIGLGTSLWCVRKQLLAELREVESLMETASRKGAYVPDVALVAMGSCCYY